MRAFVRFTAAALCGAFLIVMLSGCNADIPEVEVSVTATEGATSSETVSPIETDCIPAKNKYDTALPIPTPKASLAVPGIPVYREGQGICFEGVTQDDFASYLTLLQNEGFELFQHADSPNNQYIEAWLIRENETIYILDQSYIEADEGTPIIKIFYDAGYQGSDTAGRITKEEAKKLIQGFINEAFKKDPSNYSRFKAESIAELDVGDAFDKAGIQAYQVFGWNESKGCYIICGGSVIDVGLWGYITADIDRDGEYEFLTISGGYTGICSYTISVYKYGVPPGSSTEGKELYLAYRNTFFPEGYIDIKFVKTSETEVHIYSTNEYDYDTPIKDYGTLLINGNELCVPDVAAP